ncbi:ergothioneine biosynthesis protein EgtB [uncultured Marivirga sp.]|uniref:ergothioneine biosynthesis protein EgtB n=1 Tax=uncultured Marivirga sp. TaxID=1123707 RepID=UPI0030EB5198|tara:strand:- start:44199 stop:45356 length:1158 start_codon:yes stop_codon:yes gene_type:complete
MQNYFNRYQEIRKTTEGICEPLQIEDYVAQPTEDVSPPKWHLAHTTWFFETFLLKKFSKEYKEFHPQFAFLFNSYYVSAGERMLRPNRGNMTRPTVKEIYQYRKYVDIAVGELLSQIITDEMKNILEIGFNHEQQHQELLFYDIKYILGHNPLFPVYDKGFEEYFTEDWEQDWVQINKGNYKIGFEGKRFSFDNEHKYHEVHLEGAKISNRLVTNGEYAEFIEDKGYEKHTFWHSDARAWLEETGISAPLYWHKIEGDWYYYTLAGLKPIDKSAPLMHISFYEAYAFAEWKGLRLPTEIEWETASNLFDWGKRWEHTASAYLPYPGYKKPEGAIGEYNGKFMVNQMVMRGSSRATSINHSRKTYRNFFHPHLQWHFSGIRLAKDL